MAKISFVGNWSSEWQKDILTGIIGLKPFESYKKAIGAELKKLDADQKKRGELRDIEVKIDINYRKRTLDQNALLWSLYEIEASEQDKPAIEIYNDDLMEFAPRIEMFVDPESYQWLKTEYRLIEKEKYDKARNKWYVVVILTTSHYNTVQMAKWIERIFNRLAVIGVTSSNDIRDYWLKWRGFLDSEKIVLNEGLTKDEYRVNNPICEACGSGQDLQLAHIRAGHHETEDQAWNWLILCHECHIVIQHSKGFYVLIKKFPHIKNKVESALKKTLEEF